jgi:hypothetical protein
MDVEWNPGPPPAVGWYRAGVARQGQFYRWWDGSKWSLAATPWFNAEEAAEMAAMAAPADVQRRIWWAWPEAKRGAKK